MECIFDINLMTDDIREAKAKGRVVVSNGNWNETVKAVKMKNT